MAPHAPTVQASVLIVSLVPLAPLSPVLSHRQVCDLSTKIIPHLPATLTWACTPSRHHLSLGPLLLDPFSWLLTLSPAIHAPHDSHNDILITYQVMWFPCSSSWLCIVKDGTHTPKRDQSLCDLVPGNTLPRPHFSFHSSPPHSLQPYWAAY